MKKQRFYVRCDTFEAAEIYAASSVRYVFAGYVRCGRSVGQFTPQPIVIQNYWVNVEQIIQINML